MVSTIQTLIPFSRVLTHLPQQTKVGLILNALKDLIDKFLKSHINSLNLLPQIHIQDPWFPLNSLLESLGTIIFVVLRRCQDFAL